jgi:anti-sigma regulatory factor (Ser/Thr protein kinase)
MTTTLQPPSLTAALAAEQSYLQIPSQPEWIAPTVEYLREKAVLSGVCDEARARKLVLALHEALTNSVVHGNLELSSDLKEQSDSAFAEALAARSADPHFGTRPVDVQIDYDGERCRWTFTDQGKGFDVERAMARAAQPDPEMMLLASGRGILMMRALLDDLQYEAGGRRAVLTLARPGGGEQRRGERLPMQRPVQVTPVRTDGTVDWEATYEAVSQNLSADGMAILQARLATSERILIGLEWEGRMVYVPAEVRHCQSRSGDVVELGCRFQPAAVASARTGSTAHVEKSISDLLDELHQPSLSHDERRSHPRAAYTARVLIQRESDDEPIIGFGRDLSRGGIAFVTSQRLAQEAVILSLPQRDPSSLRVLARVVRCNQLMEGIFDVGAQFVDLAELPSAASEHHFTCHSICRF